eukprot:scaffold115959_cov43-Cyclotella_meneghiniana.AAC.1
MPEHAPVSAKSSLKMANFGRPLQQLHCRYQPPSSANNCFEDLKRLIVGEARSYVAKEKCSQLTNVTVARGEN